MALAAIRLGGPMIHLVLMAGHAELALSGHAPPEGQDFVTSGGGASQMYLHGMGRGRCGDMAGTAGVPDLMVLLMAGVAVDLNCAEL